MGYILAVMILIGLWAAKDDDDVLNIRVVALVVIVSSLFALVRVVALRHVLADLLGDLLWPSGSPGSHGFSMACS